MMKMVTSENEGAGVIARLLGGVYFLVACEMAKVARVGDGELLGVVVIMSGAKND